MERSTGLLILSASLGNSCFSLPAFLKLLRRKKGDTKKVGSRVLCWNILINWFLTFSGFPHVLGIMEVWDWPWTTWKSWNFVKTCVETLHSNSLFVVDEVQIQDFGQWDPPKTFATSAQPMISTASLCNLGYILLFQNFAIFGEAMVPGAVMVDSTLFFLSNSKEEERKIKLCCKPWARSHKYGEGGKRILRVTQFASVNSLLTTRMTHSALLQDRKHHPAVASNWKLLVVPSDELSQDDWSPGSCKSAII